VARRIDLALVAACLASLGIEVALRRELTARPLSIALVVVIALALALRRSRPLAATAGAFGAATIATLIEGAGGPASGAFILVLPYALARNGSPRAIAVGLGFMISTYAASAVRGEMPRPSDAIGAAVVMLFPGAVGIALRFRADAHVREVEHVKLREREQLARELHDSVAHHMMAITIQAQAARARPDVVGTALAAIEAESRRTLAELRSIVGALRESEETAALVPAGRIGDVASFARTPGAAPAVVVELTGDLEDVAPAVERAVYRMAQESITNALKHARGATKIAVRIAGDAASVRLTAEDDGEPSPARAPGFGLLGMAERAALLGGTFEAGPAARGWCVRAVFPRKGAEA
jgi:signal transduction histidine kinase